MNVRTICCAAALLGLLVGCTLQPVETVPRANPPATATAIPSTATPTPTPTPTPSPTPTATPTPTPTPTATPTPTPTPTPEPITQAMLDSGMFDAFYDDTVFVGDSITISFGNFIRGERQKQEGVLGTAQFLGVGSMSISVASINHGRSEGVTFTYRGKPCSLSYALNAMGAKRAVILLGINDISRNREAVKEAYRKLIGNLQTDCPDTEILVLAFLSVSKSYCEKHSVSIREWGAFRDELGSVVESCGVEYLSFASEVMDENGYLDSYYSSDNYFHLNKNGNTVWLNFLRRYAASKLRPGAVILPAEEAPTEP